ncbi:MAG: repressor LexA [Elusimicrobia bacterium]|nr:repressor LexA [Elusimicrobiota bacterium]
MDRELTDRQRQVLRFIQYHLQRHQVPPTVREIAGQFHFASPRTVQDHLRGLIRAGVVRVRPHIARGIELLGGGVGIPIVGRVPAGTPSQPFDEVEGYLEWRPLSPPDGQTFALRVKGDSMVNAGILDGDYVLVRRQETAEDKDIVVALVDGEATVKRLVKQDGTSQLVPENPSHGAISLRHDSQLVGKVIGVFRRYV